ncbi:amidohydrolase family protein [Rhodococcus globerulus]|uniref:amidohydrolase family protein n=1 Tax=Rhodococcus globerulus TaxID=33008 RepID=UPI001F3A0DC2|nr:amidohydrolase family protein [Rhodococcus globerulus]MCE4267531.1 amidohydrolase family protein [Rhodococcus globerulus]
MTIIDVDAHFEPTVDWLDEFPRLKERLPQKYPESDPRFALAAAEHFAFMLSDDLLRHVAPEHRMPISELVTPHCNLVFDVTKSDAEAAGYRGATQNPEFVDPAARIAWMDEQGISLMNVISGMVMTLSRAIEDAELGMETLEALNGWMADRCADHLDRMIPTTTLRYEDPDWCVKELTRMRERGSRFFLLNAEPVNNVAPIDPMYDRVWDAAADLGMAGLIHVGLAQRTFHPGWARIKDPMVLRVLSTSFPSQTAETWLIAWIMSGHFDRHPNFNVVMAEQGIDWVAPLGKRLDQITVPGVSKAIVAGGYTADLKPSEYIRRQVRVSPLPTPAFDPMEMLAEFPEVGVYSSDYPHFEGSDRPTEHYEEMFATRGTQEGKEMFYRSNILDVFERIGDPLQ